MLFRKKNTVIPYDPAAQKPILRKSICTGETTAGFKDIKTGVYTDVMLIRDTRDLQEFMDTYGITSKPETEY
ncbi:MAG: aspartate dehydrogenase [Clostridia bacterium]|nr:aspartate dehydrogenase [Clostridia bacterium]